MKKEMNDNILGFINFDTIEYYSEVNNSQKYLSSLLPESYYPSKGNFIAFVSNYPSKKLLNTFKSEFTQHSSFTLRNFSSFAFIRGFNSSDQWSFWKNNYQAIMITDTAPLRYPFYHTRYDTFEKVDYVKLETSVLDLEKTIKGLDENIDIYTKI